MSFAQRFAQPSEVLAALSADFPCDAAHNFEATKSWDLGLGFDGAITAYRDGWQDGADRCLELAKTLVVAPVRTRRKLKPAMAGHVANVPAHLAGSPISMYATTRRQVTGGAHVSIYVPLDYPGACDAPVAFARGVAIVAVIDALEDAGCRCEVTGLMGFAKSHGDAWSSAVCQQFFTLKTWSQPLSIEGVLFPIAHPAMSRRIGFRLIECSPDEACRGLQHKSYGYAPKTPSHDELDADPADTAIFPFLTRHDRSTEPSEWVARLIDSLPTTARAALNA
jgi:hypothetical protein